MMLKYSFIIIFAALFMTSCSNTVKEKVGLANTGPDEYMLVGHKGLDVPPIFDLPIPKSEEQRNASHQSSANVSNNNQMDDADKNLAAQIEANLVK